MNPTLAGLLQACVEDPDDATSHLVLADWMEDQSQPERAELIRVQCRLADWVPDWQERQTLIARQDELVAAHSARWLGFLGEFATEVEFVRGLCRLRLPNTQVARREFGDEFTARREIALVSEVSFVAGRSLKKLVTRPWLEWVPSLSVAGLDLDDGNLELLQVLHPHLVALDFSNNRGGPRAVQMLLAGYFFANLKRLSVRNNNLSAAQVEQLLRADWPALKELDFGCNILPSELSDASLLQRFAPRPRNSLGMEFVEVPAGSFLMGASDIDRNSYPEERPRHPVTITQSFYLGRFTVTQREYRAVAGLSPSHFTGHWLPVEQVGPVEAEDFCRRLSSLPAERKVGRSYRLPTEAEWEHACRAGTFTVFHFGNEPNLDRMNYQGRWEASDPRVKFPTTTRPVGTYRPNAFGLHEMHGNVWESCSDWYGDTVYQRDDAIDPRGRSEGDFRVRRGGCWEAIGSFCRAAKRHGAGPESGGTRHHGFRLVMTQTKGRG